MTSDPTMRIASRNSNNIPKIESIADPTIIMTVTHPQYADHACSISLLFSNAVCRRPQRGRRHTDEFEACANYQTEHCIENVLGKKELAQTLARVIKGRGRTLNV